MTKTPRVLLKYTTYQERRAKRALAKINAWRDAHQEAHELRIRELFKLDVDCWR